MTLLSSSERAKRLKALLLEMMQVMWSPGLNLVQEDRGFTYRYTLRPVLHCENEPAVIYPNGGTKCWFFRGKRHRTNGPAIEYSSGEGLYFIKGKELTKEEYLNRDTSKDRFDGDE